MKRLLIALLFILSVPTTIFATDENFDITMNLLASIAITETQALSFPDTAVVSVPGTVVVDSMDGTSARFDVTGSASENIAVSVGDVVITDGSTDIEINTWTITDQTGAAITAFDGSGDRTVHVGATANLEVEDAAGAYTGSATLTVVYN